MRRTGNGNSYSMSSSLDGSNGSGMVPMTYPYGASTTPTATSAGAEVTEMEGGYLMNDYEKMKQFGPVSNRYLELKHPSLCHDLIHSFSALCHLYNPSGSWCSSCIFSFHQYGTCCDLHHLCWIDIYACPTSSIQMCCFCSHHLCSRHTLCLLALQVISMAL